MLKHCGTKLLETDRLILRRFTIEDAEAMYKNWASDDEVTKFLTWPTHGSADISRMVVTDWVNSYEKDNFYNWAIELKEIGEIIGNISSVGGSDAVGRIHMGYCIGASWWGKGIVSEALECVMKFFFEEVEANRIDARHDVNNPASGKVMKKCGMTYEGTLRQYDINNQGIGDTAYYGILRDEWLNRSKS